MTSQHKLLIDFLFRNVVVCIQEIIALEWAKSVEAANEANRLLVNATKALTCAEPIWPRFEVVRKCAASGRRSWGSLNGNQLDPQLESKTGRSQSNGIHAIDFSFCSK